MSKQSLGVFITVRRKELGLTQAQVSQACRRSQSWLSKVERGDLEPSVTETWYLCNVLMLSPLEIVSEACRAPDESLGTALKNFIKMKKGKAEAIRQFYTARNGVISCLGVVA